MVKKGITRLLWLWLGISLVCNPAWPQNNILVIEGGTLIDGTGGAPRIDAVVIVEGSRIKAIGTKGQIPYPPNAHVIQEDGKTILPGLIDSHIHLREWMPPLFLHYGVTTVYDISNPTEWVIAQREAFKHGRIKGPRMFVSGAAIGGRTDPNNPKTVGGFFIHVGTPQEARAAVKNNVMQRVDMIETDFGLRPELIKAIVNEAATQGVSVTGHADNTRDATLAGLKFMEHTTGLIRAIPEDPEQLRKAEDKITQISGHEYLIDEKLFDPLINLMVKEGVFINPTLFAVWPVTNPRTADWARVTKEAAKDPALKFVPSDVRQGWSQPQVANEETTDPQQVQVLAGFKKAQEFTRRYAKAGGKLLAGSDVPIEALPGLSLTFEMESLVDAGATPMQAILAATKWPAEFLHKEKEIGTLEVGKVADIVTISGDPLKDIRTVRNVGIVIKDGEIIDTSYDPEFVNPIPRSVNNQRLGPDRGPAITSVTPSIAREGDQDVTVQIVGTKFSVRSVARFDMTDLKTEFISSSTLRAIIHSSSLKQVGTYAVTVANPGSGGGTSNSKYFIVDFRY